MIEWDLVPTVPMDTEWHAVVHDFGCVFHDALDLLRRSAEAEPESIVDELFRVIFSVDDRSFCGPDLLEYPIAIDFRRIPPVSVIGLEYDREFLLEACSWLSRVFRD